MKPFSSLNLANPREETDQTQTQEELTVVVETTFSGCRLRLTR